MKVRIREIMSEKGVTSVELAERIGVSKATISNLINNKTMPSIETLGKISIALGVPDWQLFASTEEVAENISCNKEIDKNTITCPKCGTKFRMEEE